MRISILLAIAVIAIGVAKPALAQDATPPTKITGVYDGDGNSNPTISIGQRLKVAVDGTAKLNPADYVLILDGRPIDGLDDTVFDSPARALVFRLMRNPANAPVWKGLIGSPTSLRVAVTVTLGKKASPGTPASQPLTGNGSNDVFSLAIAPTWRYILAVIPIIVVIAFLWFVAKRTTLLKDNSLPQIDPVQQQCSLGRCQMAFWFILVFASFVSLYALFWDYHSLISVQSLWLMGISGTTGVGAVAIDWIKDSPADKANRALCALGFNSFADVTRMKLDIAAKSNQIKASPPPAADVVKKLDLEIQDHQRSLISYEMTIKPFLSEGWFRDITTDQNGASLARLQTFFWTCALGVVFLFGVYTDLAMPQFDSNMLLLMGVSSAGYLGFKYREPGQ